MRKEGGSRLGAVVITRNRPGAVDAIGGLLELPEAPKVVVVDNASSDATPERVAECFPRVRLIRLRENLGGAARNVGVAALDTPYVAFCDDDMWWEPGSLSRGAGLMDAHPRLGLIAARVLVGPGNRLDPTCAEMARSPLPSHDRSLPGVPVLGFIAGGAIVRRRAFLEAGGFERRYVVGGEEELLALALVEAGWALRYVEHITTHHHPSPSRSTDRLWIQRRNAVWTAWLRRSRSRAFRETARLAGEALADPVARRALREAAVGAGWAWRSRRPLSPALETYVRLID